MGQNKKKNALKNSIAYFRFALPVGHLYLFYPSIREVALPYKIIVF